MAKRTKILIVGNGFGGVYTLKSLRKIFHADHSVEIAMIGEKNYFLFTPLLHEVATGGINPENIIEPIRKVMGCCLTEFYLGKTEHIDLDARTLRVDGFSLDYDFLVLAPGAQTNFYGIPEAEKYSFPLKSLEDAIKLKNHCIAQMECASQTKDEEEQKKKLTFVIVGGGPTGVELAAELQELIKENFSHYYSRAFIKKTSVILIQNASELVPNFGKRVREKSLEVLSKKGIQVMLDTAVKEVGPAHVILSNGEKISTHTVVWVAGIKPADIKFDQDVEKNQRGQIFVNEYLQIENHKNVFAVGDYAEFKNAKTGAPLPALAQVAEKEAKSVAKNIQLAIKNKKLKPFAYRHAGDMLSVGRWMAIGEVLNFTFWGGITWWIWRTVYLSKLISFRKKVRVAIDWTMDIFSPRDISQF